MFIRSPDFISYVSLLRSTVFPFVSWSRHTIPKGSALLLAYLMILSLTPGPVFRHFLLGARYLYHRHDSDLFSFFPSCQLLFLQAHFLSSSTCCAFLRNNVFSSTHWCNVTHILFLCTWTSSALPCLLYSSTPTPITGLLLTFFCLLFSFPPFLLLLPPYWSLLQCCANLHRCSFLILFDTPGVMCLYFFCFSAFFGFVFACACSDVALLIGAIVLQFLLFSSFTPRESVLSASASSYRGPLPFVSFLPYATSSSFSVVFLYALFLPVFPFFTSTFFRQVVALSAQEDVSFPPVSLFRCFLLRTCLKRRNNQ